MIIGKVAVLLALAASSSAAATKRAGSRTCTFELSHLRTQVILNLQLCRFSLKIKAEQVANFFLEPRRWWRYDLDLLC